MSVENKFFKDDYREFSYYNPSIDKKFHRNNYYKSSELVEIARKKNKKYNVYTSIYGYSEKPATSTKVNSDTVIFDRLIYDFDVQETDEYIIKFDNPNVDVATMTSDAIKYEADHIKSSEQSKLAEMSDYEIRDYYYEKYLKGYLNKPLFEAKKVANYFKNEFNIEPMLFFSGGKGVHLVVLLNKSVELKDGNRVITHIFNKIRCDLDLTTADASVSTSYENHQIRLPTSMHQKTKLFANQIFVDSSLDEILESALIQKEIDDIIVPSNDTSFLEKVIRYTDERLQIIKKNNAISKEINKDVEYSFNNSSNIHEDEVLQEMFLKVYKRGQMNEIGYRFVHLCYRSKIPKIDVQQFFANLDIEHNLNEVYSWIDRCYSLNIGTDIVTGLNHFLEGIKEFADVDDVELLIGYFSNLFTKKDIIKTEEFEPFSILGRDDKYDVEATTVNGKYASIVIKKLLGNENLSFKLDLTQKNAYFIAKEVPLKLKYKFNDSEFKLTPKDRLNSHKTKIRNICSVEIGDIADSLDIYFTNLYEKISETNKIDEREQIFYLADANPTDSRTLRNLSKILKEELHIKKTNAKNHPYYYLEDDATRCNSPTMKQIDENRLGNVLEQEYNLTLPLNSVKTILSCIHGDYDIDNSKWEFADGYYLRTDSTYDVKAISDPIVTPKKLGKKIGQKFYFYQYKPKVKLINEEENETLVESVLKKIFIPKDDPNDKRLYYDFLERLGASFMETNVHKTLTMYYGKGDNGKSLLSHLMKIIFTEFYYIGITPKELKDDLFNDARSNGKHITTIDELDRDSFRKIQAILKRRSNGTSNQSIRDMNTTDSDELATYGMMYLFTNIIPDVDVTDKQFLERLDILELPNQFKSNPKKNLNQYKKERFLEQKIADDFDGLEWLVNASIKAYMNVDFDFKCKQSKKETLDIILDTNELKKYLMLYTEPRLGSTIGTSEISDGFKDYADKNDIKIDMTENKLVKKIGMELSSIYSEDELDKNKINNKTVYSLRILSSDEVEKNNKSTEYVISEYKINWENELKGDTKVIYQWIKDGNLTTFDELCKERNPEVVQEAINYLLRIKYIEKKLGDD